MYRYLFLKFLPLYTPISYFHPNNKQYREMEKMSYIITKIFVSYGACGKEPTRQCRGHEKWVQSLSWEDTLERKWQPTPVFLPGESHKQRGFAGYSPWGLKESDTTEATWIYVLCTCSVMSVFFTTPCTMPCQAPLSMGILQVRILEWIAMPSSRGSSQPSI